METEVLLQQAYIQRKFRFATTTTTKRLWTKPYNGIEIFN